MSTTESLKDRLVSRLRNEEFKIAQAIGDAEMDRIVAALADDDVRITVTVYHDGWVSNSSKTKMDKGRCATFCVSVAGDFQFDSSFGTYDRRRSFAQGPKHTIAIAKAGQKRGRYI